MNTSARDDTASDYCYIDRRNEKLIAHGLVTDHPCVEDCILQTLLTSHKNCLLLIMKAIFSKAIFPIEEVGIGCSILCNQ